MWSELGKIDAPKKYRLPRDVVSQRMDFTKQYDIHTSDFSNRQEQKVDFDKASILNTSLFVSVDHHDVCAGKGWTWMMQQINIYFGFS